VTGVVVVGEPMNNFHVLGRIDANACLSVKELYEKISSLKKNEYDDIDRIIFTYKTKKQKKLIEDILIDLDIPNFFIIYQKSNDSFTGLDFNFSESMCIYPWIGMRITPVGDVSPCCIFNEPIDNIKNNNIKDIYLSDRMKNLRTKFLNNEKPTECSNCWKNEKVGKTSQRQAAKYKFKQIYYTTNYLSEDLSNLQNFDLALGNNCNLSCKICNPKFSSTIAKHQVESNLISIDEYQYINESTQWVNSDTFWNEFLSLGKNIKFIDLAGGEPLLNKSHFTLLKKLINQGLSKNIKLDYNSNGTVYSEKFFQLWDQFEYVKISFSIDDISDRFEQQRCGAVWNTVVSNIIQYNQHRSHKFSTEICCTVNIQNIEWLPELLDWAQTLNFDNIYLNSLFAPHDYNVAFLSKKEKQRISLKLKNSNHQLLLNSIINLLDEK